MAFTYMNNCIECAGFFYDKETVFNSTPWNHHTSINI